MQGLGVGVCVWGGGACLLWGVGERVGDLQARHRYCSAQWYSEIAICARCLTLHTHWHNTASNWEVSDIGGDDDSMPHCSMSAESCGLRQGTRGVGDHQVHNSLHPSLQVGILWKRQACLVLCAVRVCVLQRCSATVRATSPPRTTSVSCSSGSQQTCSHQQEPPRQQQQRVSAPVAGAAAASAAGSESAATACCARCWVGS